MEHQRVTQSAQKKQPKAPSSSQHQTSLHRVATHPLLELQRTIGNQAVLNLLRSRNMQSDTTTHALIEPRFGHDFSRIPVYSSRPPVLQTKLKINQPEDSYEQEAERGAGKVMQMEAQGSSQASTGSQDAQLGASGFLTRNEASDTSVHGKAGTSPIVNEVLRDGGGQPLDDSTRAFMEPRFGHDFSQVRVHNDAQAGEAAASVHSLAYTIGRNIVFGTERYAPGTMEGRRLLAHELTHVVQQKKANGNSLTENMISHPADPAEHEAANVAHSIIQGEPIPDIIAVGKGVQRDVGWAKRGPLADPYGDLWLENGPTEEREKREVEEFKQELERLKREEQLQQSRRFLQVETRNYPWLALQQGIGYELASIEETVIAFIPVVGEIFILQETIQGRTLLTDEELSGWQRVLNLLLLAIPHARPILKGGKAGAQAVFRIATRSGKSVEEIVRILEGLEKLTEEEIGLLNKIKSGEKLTGTERETLGSLVEKLEGEKKLAGASKPSSGGEGEGGGKRGRGGQEPEEGEGGGRSRISGQKPDLRQIRDVAREKGIDAKKFGNFVHREKQLYPEGDYTYEGLRQLADLFKKGEF